MTIIIAILTTLLVIVSLLTILLIMVQDDQGEGFALFGSSGQNPFNTAKNPLARFTGYLGITFAILAIATAFTISRSSTRNRLQQRVVEEQLLRDEDWFLQPSSSVEAAPADILEEGSLSESLPLADDNTDAALTEDESPIFEGSATETPLDNADAALTEDESPTLEEDSELSSSDTSP